MPADDHAELQQQASRLSALVLEAAVRDRSLEVCGIVWLEHINIVTGSRELAELFYFQGLGLTRDPAKDVGTTMWANIGTRQQFHLVDASEKDGTAQVVDGCVGLALPDLSALLKRLSSVSKALKGTRFSFADLGSCVAVSCPWGNRFFVYPTAAPSSLEPPEKRQRTRMEEANAQVDQGMAVRGEAGIRFLQWHCADAGRVAHFYEDALGCRVQHDEGSSDAVVCVGPSVHLVFSTAPSPRDQEALRRASGVHICVYLCEFKRAYDRLRAKGLVWTNPRFAYLDTCDSYDEAAAGRQFRFRSLQDSSGGELAELEHEVRSLRRVQFMKQVYYVAR
mmetsp:Transcript_53374/g.155567  ORF Transcript_53374/g.155567 Transcript_53374/m.155567 type:complete len:336 (-) Transcript_53374:48-1055(-)